jgi:hypothetical protein
MGRNPKTGKEVPIAPRRVMVFKPSASLKQRLVRAYEASNNVALATALAPSGRDAGGRANVNRFVGCLTHVGNLQRPQGF